MTTIVAAPDHSAIGSPVNSRSWGVRRVSSRKHVVVASCRRIVC
jgi:hypothetical protein